jgi:hypothetical protein
VTRLGPLTLPCLQRVKCLLTATPARPRTLGREPSGPGVPSTFVVSKTLTRHRCQTSGCQERGSTANVRHSGQRTYRFLLEMPEDQSDLPYTSWPHHYFEIRQTRYLYRGPEGAPS